MEGINPVVKFSRRSLFGKIAVALIGAKHLPKIVEKVVTPPPATIAGWDPQLISLVRKSMPNLVAYDICGVQPMCGPTGLIFAMRQSYAEKGKLKVQSGPKPHWPLPRTDYRSTYTHRRDIPLSVARDRGWCLELHKERLNHAA